MMPRADAVSAREHASLLGAREDDEGEFPALRGDDGETARGRRAKALPSADRVQDRELHGDKRRHGGGDEARLAKQGLEIERHADGREEQREQEHLERLDVGFELVAEGGVGEKHAREKSAERRGEADLGHEERHARHRQQRRRDHGFAHMRQGEHVVEPVENVMANDDHKPDGRHDLDDAGDGDGGLGRGVRGEQGNEGDQRNSGEVLEKQDRKGEPRVTRRQFALLLQRLQGKGRRRQCEGESRREAPGKGTVRSSD